MELLDALRSTGAVRDFTNEPVADETLARILDTARFAPSGGNRQGWRVVVVRDPAVRGAVRDLYLPGWYDYLAIAGTGLTPFAPVTDRDAESAARSNAPAIAAAAADGPGGFAEHLDTVPVLLVLFADLRVLAAMDRDADRYQFTGGASVYPFAWSILLAAREEGLGGVITTMNIRREAEMKALLHAGPELALAAVIALGHPAHAARRLRRSRVDEFVSVDAVDGPKFGAP
jgi:nitroreductase